MNDICTSLTPDQRMAWLILRTTNVIVDIVTFGISDSIRTNVINLLLSAGIDLADKLVETLYSFRDWHISEMNAESYFGDFT